MRNRLFRLPTVRCIVTSPVAKINQKHTLQCNPPTVQASTDYSADIFFGVFRIFCTTYSTPTKPPTVTGVVVEPTQPSVVSDLGGNDRTEGGLFWVVESIGQPNRPCFLRSGHFFSKMARWPLHCVRCPRCYNGWLIARGSARHRAILSTFRLPLGG